MLDVAARRTRPILNLVFLLTAAALAVASCERRPKEQNGAPGHDSGTQPPAASPNEQAESASGRIAEPGAEFDLADQPVDPEIARVVGNVQLTIDPEVLETIIGEKVDLDLTFTDQDGTTVTFAEDYAGKTIVLTTFYTSCPVEDMCPRLTDDMAWLSRQVPRSLKEEIQFVLVSFDPQRDTPEVLKSFGRQHGVDFSNTDLLRGDIDQTRKLIEDELQLPLSVNPATNTIANHTMMVHVIDSEGRIVVERTADSSDAFEMVAKEMIRAVTIEFEPPA